MLAQKWCSAVPGVALAVAAGSLFMSCELPRATGLALSIQAPAGILDQAAAVTLSVFDAKGVTCDAMGGVSPIPKNPSTFPLKNTGCDVAGDWCTSLTLPEDGSTKMFAVQVTNASGTLGQGCVKATINQNPLQVAIKVVRFVPPACCNNGTLETGELCDNGKAAGAACSSIVADEACAADCTTNEIAVDRAPGGPAPGPGTKSAVSLAFSGGAGQLANALRAAYNDTSVGSNPDVDVRDLTSEITSVTMPSLLSGPLKIPLSCANPGGPGTARNQNSPTLAGLAPSSVIVGYLSDELIPNQMNLYATVLDGNGCAENAPVQVNTVAGGVTAPAVAAGPSGAMFVWAQNGSLFGRIFNGTTLALSAVINLGSGSTPRVAGTSSQYVVAYFGSGSADPDGVYYETVSPTGTVGMPVPVNAKVSGPQDQPAIAAFSDGRFAIAFRSAGDIFLQRYDATGAAVSGDQDNPFDTTSPGSQTTPTIASGNSPTQGDFYVAAWATATGDVMARLAGGTSGFLFNQINGQNTDFLVNKSGEVRMRANPAVVVGGGGYIVFGWDDASASTPGVFVRRFPVPQ